jgi:hypothetical protein
MADHPPAPHVPDAPEKLARSIVGLTAAGALAFLVLVLIFVIF